MAPPPGVGRTALRRRTAAARRRPGRERRALRHRQAQGIDPENGRAKRKIAYAKAGIETGRGHYQHDAYLIDLELLGKLGKFKPDDDVAASRAWAADASESELESARGYLTREYFGGDALTDAKQLINQRLQLGQFRKDTDRLLAAGKITKEQADPELAWAENASYSDLLAERERVERHFFGHVTQIPEFRYR